MLHTRCSNNTLASTVVQSQCAPRSLQREEKETTINTLPGVFSSDALVRLHNGR